eukprot:CAMPEP_0174892738 /NCGR_PEP_ID=MMETSP0167-20121228/7647_1 /TAXON_ID=38298 /ORGANISM="Rhodella maculata, Strain CCMP736" /LENGTH=32 /DNA_ID= /DNA_START= /DNA_END= /DNA_ORIENTATION=
MSFGFHAATMRSYETLLAQPPDAASCVIKPQS